MNTNNDLFVYWTLFDNKQWKMHIAATTNGLCYIGSPNGSLADLSRWLKKRLPNSVLVQDDQKLQLYIDELSQYFEGQRQTFTVPVDLYGTPFQLSVWNALCEIPYGQTKSYSEIADYLQKPTSIRAVGTAIGANPVLIVVPCHRVIGKNGTLTGYRGGLEMKKQLLELENKNALNEGKSLHV
ncbi:methylated-DNA--[protein]-cysteine S-methyltransferase [Bacillus smithii]|uniref:methylated-DNA--[protein]-cysteine S-methyltransferase n=1 Tax=Bacillus smithii TaxID=1479 RepID=UPI0030C96444